MAHLERLKKKARELVDERRHPPGSFQKLQYNQAKEVLDYFQRGKVHDVDCVTVSLQLLERLIAEMSIRTDEMVQRWLCDPRYFTPLFNIWKKAAMLHMDVITPRGLLIKLHTMTIKFPDFKFNIYAAGIILDVLVKQAKPEKAPAEAMDLFHYIKQEATRTQNADLSPNEYMYRRLLQIWAASGLPEAPDKMESILESMRRDLIPPNVVSYTVLLNLWARCGAVDKIAKVLETMKSEGIQPDIMCLSRALHGFAQAGKTEEAQRIVTEMMALDFNSEKHKSQLVGEGARKILFAYRTILGQEDVEGSFGLKEKIIKEAKELYLRAEKYVSSDEDEKRKLMGTMMDLYVRAGKQDEAEAIFNKMDLDIVKCTILIKSFGKEDAADRAAAVLKSMLRGSRVAPDVFIFNTLIK
jgi:pentatricopeptide repeat protein